MMCSCDKKDDGVLTLRVCNWEEYIDEGDWDEEETIDLPGGDIIGENSMIEDFEEWYEDTYGEKIKVEYSCFGTNEELYNQMTLGDKFDLVCPSEYMIMKLLNEGKLIKYDDSFFDASDDDNYYAKGVSPYISNYVKDIKVEKL
jgi:spermidine/putrescine transport system substrate-binding protein